MLVDNQRPQPLQLPNNISSFEDFFKLDLFPSDFSTTSRSPSPSSLQLVSPASPASMDGNAVAIASQDPDSFFNFYLEDDYSKELPALSMPPSASTLAPYDFFGSAAGSSSSSSGASPASITSPHFSIDPLLVDTPTTSHSQSNFGDVENEENMPNDEPEDVGDVEDKDTLYEITPIKAGGRGRQRKGTVLSGGVVKSSSSSQRLGRDKENAGPKKNTISSVVATGALQDSNDFPDDWRPTPEEYKRMSSKEKRQLRNKISARNFRVRRKEYISTLEADISERDRLLSAIRSELGSAQSENVALRQEIAALKEALLKGRGTLDMPVLPPPAPLRASTPVPASSTPSALLTANTQKDLPMSPRTSSRGFWGGVGGGLNGIGGYTPVHTAFIPELSVGLGLSKKGLLENLNPTLNNNNHSSSLQSPTSPPDKLAGFEGFSDSNLFTLRNLDTYRLHLWSKMAAQHHQHQRQQASAQQQSTRQPLFTGHAANLRRHYFQAHGSNVGLSGTLSGKAASSSSKPFNDSTNLPSSSSPTATKEQAVMAAVASHTLLHRLGSAFWDAFSGSSVPNVALHGTGMPSKSWDADKVRRVLEGKAVVRVVDIEPDVVAGSQGKSVSKVVAADTKKDKCVLTDLLVESMGGLNLGKK